MALLNPTFIFGIFVLLYLSSFVVFAVIRILTGVSIQRIGYFSLRRLAYTPRDGFKIEIRGLGLNVHRPSFAQPTWLSIVVNELAITVDIAELERLQGNGEDAEDTATQGQERDEPSGPDSKPVSNTPKIPTIRRDHSAAPRSETWNHLMKVKDRIKRLHRKVNWLRMVDVVATNSTVNVVGVGTVQFGSFTVAVDTRRKIVDRVRFFLQGRAGKKRREEQQAEWIMSLRGVLFTAEGKESLEVLDTASLNVHGFLYKALDGLRDAAISLKLGRVHIPYDDILHSSNRYKAIKSQTGNYVLPDQDLEVTVGKVFRELDSPGSTDHDFVQAVSDSKEFVSSILRGIREVQFAVTFIGFAKKLEAIQRAGPPVVLNASMKEVVVDLHRLDSKSPAHRMYFPSKDTAHEALLAALSISIGLDEGQGKPERLMYIPMATTTIRTTLPSKTVQLADDVSPEERNANILFANSVVTSPSVDLDPRHLPLLLAMLRAKPKAPKTQRQKRHVLISRLLPKANIKFSMHEPVLRIALPPVQKSQDPDDFDLIISSISSISLDLESFHSAVEELHYSLASTMRVQAHQLYYQTSGGSRYDLLETESFDLKVNLSASPDVHVVATGNLQTFSIRMVRPEVSDGLRQIVRQLRPEVEADKRAVSKTATHSNFLRAMPPWLLHFQIQASDFSLEVAGVDEEISADTRGIAIQLDSWSAEYRAQKLDGLQRRLSRRRANSRSALNPDTELLKSVPSSPRKKYHSEGDGRRVAVHVRGLEAFVVESAEKWEIEPFVNIPRFEVAFSTLSDTQGPVFHIHSHVRSLLLQYSLYRHYAVGVATMVVRKAFMRPGTDTTDARATRPTRSQKPGRADFLALPDETAPDFPLSGHESLSTRPARELVAIDFKAALVQIKADMPADPPMMVQIYGIEAGRHRWSPPFIQSKLIRLYGEAPRMRSVWARMVSIKNGRLDYRESRKKSSTGAIHEERLFDIVADAIRIAVPHEMIVNKISDNFINVFKSTQQLHHRFRTGTNEYILDKTPEPPKRVPNVSLRAKTLLFELEDGAFEWKLSMIYRAGRVEQMQRQAREEAFRVKVKKIQEEDARRESSKFRTRSAMPRRRSHTVTSSHKRSSSVDGRSRAGTDEHRGRPPRYDPEGGCPGMSGTAHVSIAEARQKLNLHNAQNWKRRIDRHYLMAKNGMKDIRSLFWGRDDVPDDLSDSENILEIPHRPALMSTLVTDLHLTIDKPSFPMKDLPDFLHKVGKGMPRDMEYSLLIPMSVKIDMGEAKVSLRDYPLPLMHVPSIKSGQSSRLPALSMRTDFVIAEEFRGVESTRRIKVNITPPRPLVPGAPNAGGFAIDVRRTIGPVKSYSDMTIDINTAHPTRITWGPSYQPAIQDMMMVIESFTKPQLDPSEGVGFWDKIRLNFHSRVRVAWREGGDVHLALKGTRDPYQITGNGAGFLMCWRNDVRWNVHTDDDPKRFMSVDSGEYVLAVPDYSYHVREARRRDGEDDSLTSDDSYKSGASFKKVAMKLSGKVQWLAGLVFEKAIEKGHRSFDFKPHYAVALKSPHYAKSQDDLPYDAFRGFRSQHIHLSIAVLAPVDREWTSANPDPSRSYNTVHLTPRLFTHFFAWWSLFGGPLSLPVRQGSLWPGREKNSKKFGRHLATIKYNLLLAPLFLSHIYKHKEIEDYSENAVSATGIKVRFDNFMLDLHQRREEFNTRDRGPRTHSRTTGMKIHAGQLDLVSADIRAVSASIRGTTAEAMRKNSISTFVTQQDEDNTDLSRFTIPDNDFSWIDMDDFVELDWILPTEPNPDTKILPLACAPRITYFRQTDIGGMIAGDPHRTSPFGAEPTHNCIMTQDDDPRRVQAQLIRQRLEQLGQQIETHTRNIGEVELRMIRSVHEDQGLKEEYDSLNRHIDVLTERKEFMEGMLRQMSPKSPSDDSTSQQSDSVLTSETSIDLKDGSMTIPTTSEFASDFKNRFVVHNMQLKWNNTLRNIILRYIHQVSQRRGFVYYLSRPAVKFILDMVDDQAKLKTAKGNSNASPAPAGASPDPNGTDRHSEKDIEDRIRKILQEGKKFVNADESSPSLAANISMEDLSSGIADGFTPQNSFHVRLIAPQIQLQSDKNKKHVILITAKGMELKAVEVMDKDRLSDVVSGLVQRRMLVNMDSTQFFVTHQKWFSTQLVSMYSGSTYGTPNGSSWPPWVPMEVMFDFQTDPFGFKRVVQKTSAMLRFDKFNTLRLKYNDEVNTDEGAADTTHDNAESRMDNLWVEFPQVRALCNSSQYYAMFVIVVDLLMYSEPLEKTRSERLEKIILASDFSDLRGAPEMVIKLQERVKQLEDIKTHFQVHSKYLDKKGWQDRLTLERDLSICEDELFFMMKAITTSQRKYENTASHALLKWSISAREIVWHLIRDNNEPLVELQLKDVEYDRTDNLDGSHINLIQVGKVLGLNLLPDAIYPTMIAPYLDSDKGVVGLGSQPMIRVYWYMLEAIAGIPVMDHFEVNLFPMKIQLEREVGKKLFEYIFPGADGPNGKNASSLVILPDTEEDPAENDSLSSSTDRPETSDREKDPFTTRPGSLELRLRPTLTSDFKPHPADQKALSVHTSEGTAFRLFRAPNTGSTILSKKPSFGSLRNAGTPQPGISRSATAFSRFETGSTASDSKKSSRFGLRNKSSTKDESQQQSDDLTKMITRASNYMTFAYIKMPSVVLCLSYKGKGDRNIEDVHDFVFRLPTIEYRNKTWSNLDLALALKSRVIKALISHTGAIIGNKFKHRPNTAQQSKLREIATSSVLLVTPQLSESRDNSGDDSSSLYGTSPVDFSRSPPRSLRGSHSSIPMPRPGSRSSSVASSRSHRSNHHVVTAQPSIGGPVPSFLMMTPPLTQEPTVIEPRSRRTGLGADLLRPMSSGGSRLFGGGGGSNSNIPRPSSSGSSLGVTNGDGTGDGHRSRRAGGGGYLRDKFNAFATRLKEREGSSTPTTPGRGEEDEVDEDGDGHGGALLGRSLSRGHRTKTT